jgi:CheY-like chemotaxis protein
MTELLERALGPTVTVRVDFREKLPPVRTDPNQLESALLNLSVNARDAMQGEGEIVISARSREAGASESGLQPGTYICLSVADSGEGMDEETLKRATEPFFTTKGVGKGTGLGLSMVLGPAEQSGGTLILHSRKGKGTLAEIWLPAASGEVEPVAAAVSPPADVPPPRVRMHLLSIDDDPLVLMNTAAMLEDMGHTVTAVGSGREALNLLGSGKKFDMVITDHAMPHMTGSQFAAEAMRRDTGLKVLLATGYAELPSGADIGLPRLAKPFTQRQLAEAIARLAAS